MSQWARTSSGDMYLPPNGQGAQALVFEAGPCAAIKIPSVLQFVKGEWQLDTSLGFDWLSIWSQKNPPIATVEARIRNAIVAVPLVAGVTDLGITYDPSHRNLQYSAAVKLTTGQTVNVP